MIQSQMQKLRDLWTQLKANHLMLEKSMTSAAKASFPYFTPSILDDMEDIVDHSIDFLTEASKTANVREQTEYS